MARIDLGGSRTLFLSLCGLVGLAFVAVLVSKGNEAQSRLSNEVRNTIADYYHAVVSAEKSQRAYILTEDADYLDDYREAKDSIDVSRRILKDVVGESSVLSDDLITLFQLTDEGRIADEEPGVHHPLAILEAEGGAGAVDHRLAGDDR